MSLCCVCSLRGNNGGPTQLNFCRLHILAALGIYCRWGPQGGPGHVRRVQGSPLPPSTWRTLNHGTHARAGRSEQIPGMRCAPEEDTSIVCAAIPLLPFRRHSHAQSCPHGCLAALGYGLSLTCVPTPDNQAHTRHRGHVETLRPGPISSAAKLVHTRNAVQPLPACRSVPLNTAYHPCRFNASIEHKASATAPAPAKLPHATTASSSGTRPQAWCSEPVATRCCRHQLTAG
jgi:hypothetical protein